MNEANFVLIGADEVKKVFKNHLNSLLTSLESALASYSSNDGEVVQPIRTPISVAEHNGSVLTMPAYSKREQILTTKVVTIYPENPIKFKLPTIQSQVFVFAAQTGTLKSIIDGNSMTALRTAAASAIASKYLASPNSKILAILGSGVQARSHFQVLSSLFQFKELRIWNVRLESANQFANEINLQGLIKAKCCESAEEAVRDADIIVTCTLSTQPILKGAWVKKGAHINAVGACDPTWRELDDQLMQNAKIYVDSREASKVESGDIILAQAEVYAEIGEVILKEKLAYLEETTVFKSLGMAIEDTISASIIYNHQLNGCQICLN